MNARAVDLIAELNEVFESNQTNFVLRESLSDAELVEILAPEVAYLLSSGRNDVGLAVVRLVRRHGLSSRDLDEVFAGLSLNANSTGVAFPAAEDSDFKIDFGLMDVSEDADWRRALDILANVCAGAGIKPEFIRGDLIAHGEVAAKEALMHAVLSEAISLRNRNLALTSLELLDRAIAIGLDTPWIRDNRARAFISLDRFEHASMELRVIRSFAWEAHQLETICADLEKIIRANGLTKADLEEINAMLASNGEPNFFSELTLNRGVGKLELNERLSALIDSGNEMLALPVLKALFSTGKSTSYLNETFVRGLHRRGLNVSYELFGIEESEADQSESSDEPAPSRSHAKADRAFEDIQTVVRALVQNGYESLLSPANLVHAEQDPSRLRGILRTHVHAALHSELHKGAPDIEKAMGLINSLANHLGDDDDERVLNICRLMLAADRPAEARALAEKKLTENTRFQEIFNGVINRSMKQQLLNNIKARLNALPYILHTPSAILAPLFAAKEIDSLSKQAVGVAHYLNKTSGIDSALNLLSTLGPHFDKHPALVECKARIYMDNALYEQAVEFVKGQSRFFDGEQRESIDSLVAECKAKMRVHAIYNAIESSLAVASSKETLAEAWKVILYSRGAVKEHGGSGQQFERGIEYYANVAFRLTGAFDGLSAFFSTPRYTDTVLPSALWDDPVRRYKDFKPSHETFDVGPMPHNPLVSVIIVAYNSESDLVRLLPTLREQSYKNIEVILVDNGVDNSREVLAGHFPIHKYSQEDNIGFAEANNIGLSLANGELILLLNPDTRLRNDTLSELVEALRADGTAAVAVPKILFDGRFSNLQLFIDDGSVALVARTIIANMNYKKYFIRAGQKSGEDLVYPSDGVVSLDIPVPQKLEKVALKFKFVEGSPHKFDVGVRVGRQNLAVHQVDESGELVVEWPAALDGSFSIINNAGSEFSDSNEPYDRGFGQRDTGQYQQRARVQALCGCCALIRRLVFLRRKVFNPYFFAYYEDSELSFWMKENELPILYTPFSVVEHRHSESTSEYSHLWHLLVGRSGLLFRAVRDKVELDQNVFSVVETLYEAYGDRYSNLLRRLRTFDEELKHTTFEGAVEAPRTSVGIYNSYFSTMGGGERHCLELASRISHCRNIDLYLISEKDFSIDELGSFFGIDLSKCRKLILGAVTSVTTSFFDVFINSTYMSKLISYAKASFFITSFPAERVAPEFIDRYFFLHNSPFTEAWANVYWGQHRSLTLLPIIGFSEASAKSPASKKRMILNVGRFNYGGHCKNQHLIVHAFVSLVDAGLLSRDWTLRLIGSVDNSVASSVRHYTDVLEMSKGYNVEIHPNGSATFVKKSYEEALIYCHGTGCGLLEAEDPALHEHFGIAVFEALLHGCLPCVASTAGPLAMTRAIKNVSYFSDSKTLENALVRAVATAENEAALASAQAEIRGWAKALLQRNEGSVEFVVDLIKWLSRILVGKNLGGKSQ
jgi:GT2 family glycosyltransferase